MHSGLRWAAIAAALMVVAPACIEASPTKPSADAGGAGGSASHPSSKGGTAGKGGVSGSSGGGAGGTAGGAGTGGVMAPPTGSVPVLTTAEAHVTGRNGDDVTLSVSGTDVDANVELVSVSFEDEAGNAVTVFDTDGDAEPDSASRRLFLDASVLGKKTFSGTVTLTGFAGRFPDAVGATLHLEDLGRNSSEALAVTVVPQAERALGDGCDATILEDRCADGLSCGGEPTVCQASAAPALTKLAYVQGPQGPRLLALGTDPDDDIGTLHLDFFDHAGKSVSVDLNADQVPDSSGFDLTVFGASQAGSFFVADQLGLDFQVTSPKITVTPIDGQSNSGEPKTVDFADPPSRKTGEACDPRGFDACSGLSVCSPGIASEKNSCAALSGLQTRACGGAVVLDPEKGILSTFGRAEGVSLWDPPVGCGQVSAVKRPEGVVRLHLGASASHLTVTTALPETSFDTILYVVSGCSTSADKAAPCNDDVSGARSTVEIDTPAAGDYLIIVDSADERGGGFGVSVVVE